VNRQIEHAGTADILVCNVSTALLRIEGVRGVQIPQLRPNRRSRACWS